VTEARRITGWRRHLEGWQPASVAVLLAGSVAALAVPRPVDPVEIPDPVVDSRSIERIAAIDASRAAAATREVLDVDVRALGTEIRAYGRADADGDLDAGLEARRRVLAASQAAIARGAEPVLRLRAFQLSSFVREVHRWEATGTESVELRELGGGFVRTLRANGWVNEEPSGRRLEVDAPALTALFKKRWNDVTGISGGVFDLALDEQRALYRFLIRNPTSGLPVERAPSARARGLANAQQEQHRMKKIEELAALDPSYPADLARGVVLYHLARYPLAVEKFRQHLEAFPDGPWTLRAQNYLRAALGRARSDEP